MREVPKLGEDPIAGIAELEAVLKRLAPAERALFERLVLPPWRRRPRQLRQQDALIPGG